MGTIMDQVTSDPATDMLPRLWQAYLNGDAVTAEALGTEIFTILGDNPLSTQPKVAATARLFVGWAIMHRTLQTKPLDRDALRRGMSTIESVQNILLVRDDMFLERVVAECYLALGTFRLGDQDNGRGKLNLLRSAVIQERNLEAAMMFAQMCALIRRSQHAPVNMAALAELKRLAAPLREDQTELGEHVALECYLALSEYCLGHGKAGRNRLDELTDNLDAPNGKLGLKMKIAYIMLLIAIRRILGEDIDYPLPLPLREEPLTPEATDNAGGQEQILMLDDESHSLISEALRLRRPAAALEITRTLTGYTVTMEIDSWILLFNAHTWALVQVALEAETAEERNGHLAEALPFLQELSDKAFELQHAEVYAPVTMDLAYALFALGFTEAAERHWRAVCGFVNEAKGPVRAQLDAMLRATQDRIGLLYTNSRPIGATS